MPKSVLQLPDYELHVTCVVLDEDEEENLLTEEDLHPPEESPHTSDDADADDDASDSAAARLKQESVDKNDAEQNSRTDEGQDLDRDDSISSTSSESSDSDDSDVPVKKRKRKQNWEKLQCCSALLVYDFVHTVSLLLNNGRNIQFGQSYRRGDGRKWITESQRSGRFCGLDSANDSCNVVNILCQCHHIWHSFHQMPPFCCQPYRKIRVHRTEKGDIFNVM